MTSSSQAGPSSKGTRRKVHFLDEVVLAANTAKNTAKDEDAVDPEHPANDMESHDGDYETDNVDDTSRPERRFVKPDPPDKEREGLWQAYLDITEPKDEADIKGWEEKSFWIMIIVRDYYYMA